MSDSRTALNPPPSPHFVNPSAPTQGPSQTVRPSIPGAPASNGHAPGARSGHGGEQEHVQMDLPKISPLTSTLILLVLGALLVALFFAGWIPHTRAMSEVKHEAEQAASAKPLVELVTPKESGRDAELLLPGDLRANQMTAIFARTSGYLKPLPPGIDIGASVKQGQLIASIAAPELDAQLDQARASLDQARAAVTRAEAEHDLAVTTLKRYEDPVLGKAVAPQDVDVKRSQENTLATAAKEAQINVSVAEAAVKRLSELQGFETITAPFAGVVTARGYDSGALVAASDSGAGKPMFVIEQTDLLRVVVNVPQGYSTDVRAGQSADLLVMNFPGRPFAGTVARTAGALDTGTRTLRVEVEVPNTSSELLPGMYGQVRFRLKRDRPTIILPTSVLRFGPEGQTVGVVQNGHVSFRKVDLGRDFGAEAEVLTGVSASDAVVGNPGLLADGEEVEVKKPVEKPTTKPAGTARPG